MFGEYPFVPNYTTDGMRFTNLGEILRQQLKQAEDRIKPVPNPLQDALVESMRQQLGESDGK